MPTYLGAYDTCRSYRGAFAPKNLLMSDGEGEVFKQINFMLKYNIIQT